MRLISTKNCQAGMILAKTLYNDTGHVLLSEGVSLTKPMIERMQSLGISLIYIHDERTKDIEHKEVLTEQTRKHALHTIQSQFKNMVKDGKLVHTAEASNGGKAFRGVVKNILNDIRSHKQAMSLLTDVCTYDQYIFQHSLNVTVYTLAIALAQGYNETQLEEIGLGAILHDIGKLAVPLEILTKPDKLTNEEFSVVQEHTTNGFQLLRKIYDLPLLAAHCAYQHHERLDGSGYPRKLKGDKIHPYAKLLAITDVFDALTSNRSYRKAKLPHVAMEIIFSGAGKIFDFDLVQSFRDNIAMYPLGMMVKLSNGFSGVVVDHNRHLSSRPIVRLLKDAQGQDIDTLEEMDLSKHLSIVIEDCDFIP